jgi:hypothetical protein
MKTFIRSIIFNLFLTTISYLLLSGTIKVYSFGKPVMIVLIITYLSFIISVVTGLAYGYYSSKTVSKNKLASQVLTHDYNAKIGTVMVIVLYFSFFYLRFFGFKELGTYAFYWTFIILYLLFNSILLLYSWMSVALKIRLHLN